MKKIFMMTLLGAVTGAAMAGNDYSHSSDVLGEGSRGNAIQEEEVRDNADMNTRTMRANHATTTGSPDYADEELERYKEGKSMAPDRMEREREESRDIDADRPVEYKEDSYNSNTEE